MLRLNKWSSNYGNDWWRAIWVTLSVNTFFFVVYAIALYGVGSDIDKALDLFSYSFEYLNPLRKSDFLKEIDSTIKGCPRFARFWDYISRIIVSYFVYQTIQAFRRFGKRQV